MTDPALNPALVAKLVETSPGVFTLPDEVAPPSVALNAQEAADSAVTAGDAAVAASAAADRAELAAQNAGSGPEAAQARDEAIAARVAAEAAQAAAEDARDAAIGAGGGGITSQQFGVLLNEQTAVVARTGKFVDLIDDPVIPTTAGEVNAIPATDRGNANGVAALNSNKELILANAPWRYVHEYRCVGGTQPTRAVILGTSARADIVIVYLIMAEPNKAAGYAQPGDRWRKESW